MWKEKEAQPMTLMIDLQPDIERGLMVQAQARGVSLADFAQEVLAREVRLAETPSHRTGQDLIDASARVRGLFTDLEIDSLFSRTPSFSRPVDF